jgi:hypothetical protein
MRNHALPSLQERIPIFMSDIFRSIADDKSLALLNIIALSDSESRSLRRKTHFSKREYSRINKLGNYGLIGRRNGDYYLTPLGRVVYAIELMIGGAANNFWQLKALDRLEINDEKGNARDSHTNVVSGLIEDEKMKDLLLTIRANSRSDLSMNRRTKPTPDFKRDLTESEVYDEFLSIE